MKTDLSIVILSFNTKDLTKKCLESVFSSELEEFHIETIVSDNASSDGTVEMIEEEFPEVILIKNKKNLGFAAGNNPGIRISRGRYILLLNSDTELYRKSLTSMIRFMDKNPLAGAATCKLVLSDGSIDPACHRGFPTPWVAFSYISGLEKLFPKTKFFGGYHQGYKNMQIPHQVDCISGAFFMVRKQVVDHVGLLDEDFFMYGEDLDWAHRIQVKGWKILFNPKVSVLHKKKQSGRSHLDRQRKLKSEIYFQQNNWLFYKKNLAENYGPVTTFCVNCFYILRIFLLTRLGI